jgi:hypothetical protein
MKTTTQEIFMITKKFHPSKSLQALQLREWEAHLVSLDLAPLESITVETQPEYILQPFRNSFDASALVEGSPINQRDAVPSHDGYATYSPMDTENILFSIIQSTEDQEIEQLAKEAFQSFKTRPKSVTTAVAIMALNKALS